LAFDSVITLSETVAASVALGFAGSRGIDLEPTQVKNLFGYVAGGIIRPNSRRETLPCVFTTTGTSTTISSPDLPLASTDGAGIGLIRFYKKEVYPELC